MTYKEQFIKDNWDKLSFRELELATELKTSKIRRMGTKMGLHSKRDLSRTKFVTRESVVALEKTFNVGQNLKLQEKETRGRIRRLKGKIVYKSKYFITLMLNKGYKESFMYVDMLLGYVEILEG